MSVSDLVGEIEDVRRLTRRASHGGAVPLALLGLLVLCAAPVYAAAAASTIVGPGWQTYDPEAHWRVTFFERLLRAHPNVTGYDGIGLYWLVAVPLAFGAIAAYYVWRARRTGLSINGWLVAAVGGGLFAALVISMYHGAASSLQYGQGPSDLRIGDFVNPFLVVAIAVLVLAWVERSVTILLAALSFGAAVATADAWTYVNVWSGGWEFWTAWGWMTVILGGVLLIWAGIVALVRRQRA